LVPLHPGAEHGEKWKIGDGQGRVSKGSTGPRYGRVRRLNWADFAGRMVNDWLSA
jgi:hypothetical protein